MAPQEWPVPVTTTMQPGVVLMVDEAEWVDLKRQGLLATDGTGPDVQPRAARERKGS
jgi:hypothetical protein